MIKSRFDILKNQSDRDEWIEGLGAAGIHSYNVWKRP